MTKPGRSPPTPSRPGHRLSRAVLDIPLRIACGQPGGAAGQRDDAPLPPAISGERRDLATPVGRLSYTVAESKQGQSAPLLLIHSVNAAASSYEVGPIFEACIGRRTVYALDLPGFGFSERSQRLYTPRIMTDAILAMTAEIGRRHGDGAIDALALSLSAEFLARAAAEQPTLFRTIGLVSPTGFDSRAPRTGPPGSTRAMPALHRAFTFGLWRRSFFALLTSRVSIRYFLEKTWGSKAIDEGLLDYDYRVSHQPGAEHAPYCFISGYLFSNDITRVYEQLAMPVWMLHGIRGDFTDYSYAPVFAARSNWAIEEVPTGALPQFELPDVFMARYEAFLAKRM